MTLENELFLVKPNEYWAGIAVSKHSQIEELRLIRRDRKKKIMKKHTHTHTHTHTDTKTCNLSDSRMTIIIGQFFLLNKERKKSHHFLNFTHRMIQ